MQWGYFYEITAKLLLACMLSAMIGLEREIHGSPAGLRTHILVCVGSCLIMLTSIHIFHVYKQLAPVDPSRIAAGVVTGIGFLGAGTILHYRGSVLGLTTAASIWLVAAVGLAVGTSFYAGALVTAALGVLTLRFLSGMERIMIRRDSYRALVLEGLIDTERMTRVRGILGRGSAEIMHIDMEKTSQAGTLRARLDIKLTTPVIDDNIILEIVKLDGVSKARWE
ncbi:MAG: MgtC/SapB family protein [Candidatus Omnitrophota bacterium]